MKHLAKPIKKVCDVLNIIKSDTTRNETILDMESVISILNDREDLYINKATDIKLFEIPRSQNLSDRVDRNKMISYYEYRLLQKSNGRAFYNETILSVPNNVCPYCTVRTVKTLDHFLPKSEYPSYSITPTNLIPSCRDCNTDKKQSYPTGSNDQTFHPYFDEVDNECWIKAELRKTEPLSFQYKVIRPVDWIDSKFQRAHSHFNGYNINQLFSNEANRELTGMQYQYKRLFIKDRDLLREHLEDTYHSWLNGHGVIDWKTLMYQELASNDWFLNGCLGTSFFT